MNRDRANPTWVPVGLAQSPRYRNLFTIPATIAGGNCYGPVAKRHA